MQNNIRRKDTSTADRTKKIIRLGKREENKTRPVLVKLGKQETAREILITAKRLRNSEQYSRVFIAKDQSKEEREEPKTRTRRAQRNRRRIVHNKERGNSKVEWNKKRRSTYRGLLRGREVYGMRGDKGKKGEWKRGERKKGEWRGGNNRDKIIKCSRVIPSSEEILEENWDESIMCLTETQKK